MALPCEIGLYFDFNVTNTGIPYGCPGFEKFNQDYFNISMNSSQTFSKSHEILQILK